MPFQSKALPLALVFVLSLPAYAEDLISASEEIIVTPTRSPQKLSDTLSAVTVITRHQIESSDAIDLPSLLQGMPGVEISQTGGYGTPSSIFMRGAESDHTLVLVDGLRTDSVSTGTTAIEHLSLDDIDHIEIVRGNVSSVYGSGAIGGVIRIFTRQGRGEIKPWLKAGAGTLDYQNLEAGIGGELQPGTQLAFSVGRLHSGGFSTVDTRYTTGNPLVDPYGSFSPADADNDSTTNTHFNLRFSQYINDSFRWGLSARQNRADVDYDGSYSNHSEQMLGGYSVFLEASPLANWNSKLTLGKSADELDSDLSGSPVDFYHTHIDQASWENTLAFNRQLLRFGIDTEDQQLVSNQNYSQAGRRLISAYAGLGSRFGAHDIDLSLRNDHYSDFGGHTTGRLAYGYQLSPSLKGYAAVSTAFKAPTFNDLYLNYPPFYFANPNLKPERSKSAELGLNYAAAGQFIQATLFVNRTRDLIAIDPVTYATTVNLDKTRNRGIELSWNGRLAGLDGRAALTLQNPEDATTGATLLRRARAFGSFSLADRIGKFGWRTELIASGQHPDIHVTYFTRTDVPGYASLNLSGDYAMTRDWKLTARVLNALDADYSLVHGYNTPGRQFQLELAYAPK